MLENFVTLVTFTQLVTSASDPRQLLLFGKVFNS